MSVSIPSYLSLGYSSTLEQLRSFQHDRTLSSLPFLKTWHLPALVVTSQQDYSDEKTSFRNGNMALCVQIMIVFRFAFLAPFSNPRLHFNKRHDLHKRCLLQTKTAVSGGFSGSRSLCLGCPIGPGLCAELPSSGIIVLTSGVAFTEQWSPCPPAGATRPRQQGPVLVSCCWLLATP